MKKGKFILKILNWILIIGAYGYLVYKLVTFDNYAGLADSFRSAGIFQDLCLVLCILLFPLNIYFEAWRWQYMMRRVEPMTMWESQKQVYYGFVGAFLTPYRAGDFPARAVMMKNQEHWLIALVMGVVSAYAITMVIILAGIPSSFFFFAEEGLERLWLPITAGGICLLLLFCAPMFFKRMAACNWRYEKTHMVMDELAAMTLGEMLKILFQSFCRYICFCVQMYLTLYFCGVELSLSEVLVALPTYYMLITVTPYVPVAEVGIRGSWAIVVFGKYAPDKVASAVIAAILIWVINTIPPMIIGSIVKKNN